MLAVACFLVLGYLCGSFPTAYLAARTVRGIDIRQYGSGNLGTANVMRHVSPAVGLAVGVVDATKALLPALLGLHWGGPWAGVAGAVGATLGHCWCAWLGFTGGRGLACTFGAVLVLFTPGLVVLAIGHIVGSLVFKRVALADWVALLVLPLCALALGSGWPTFTFCLLLLAVVTAKRLEANRAALPTERDRRRAVLRYRLLYDRDVPPDEDWTGRTPQAP